MCVYMVYSLCKVSGHHTRLFSVCVSMYFTYNILTPLQIIKHLLELLIPCPTNTFLGASVLVLSFVEDGLSSLP